MRHGENHVLWPGQVKWYAKSSGTTNDKSKFIPVSREGLHDTHYAGGQDAVTIYLHNNPLSRLFDGKALILGGSHASNYNLPHSLVGDLSAILIENINPLVNLVRVPPKRIALLSDFEEKRDRIAEIAAKQNVTNLSGVPSWMMAVLNRVLEITGKTHLKKCGLTSKCSFTAVSPLRPTATSITGSSPRRACTTWKPTTPARDFSACKTTLPMWPCC